MLASAAAPESIMDTYVDSTDRGTGDYILFALGFIGFVVGTGGVVVASLPAAVVGGALLLLVVGCFGLRSSPGERGS